MKIARSLGEMNKMFGGDDPDEETGPKDATSDDHATGEQLSFSQDRS